MERGRLSCGEIARWNATGGVRSSSTGGLEKGASEEHMTDSNVEEIISFRCDLKLLLACDHSRLVRGQNNN
jgi:hypothetical protein